MFHSAQHQCPTVFTCTSLDAKQTPVTSELATEHVWGSEACNHFDIFIRSSVYLLYCVLLGHWLFLVCCNTAPWWLNFVPDCLQEGEMRTKACCCCSCSLRVTWLIELLSTVAEGVNTLVQLWLGETCLLKAVKQATGTRTRGFKVTRNWF